MPIPRYDWITSLPWISIPRDCCSRGVADTRFSGTLYRWLRRNPKVLNLPFKKEVKRADRSNLVDCYVRGTVGVDISTEQFLAAFETEVCLLVFVAFPPPWALCGLECVSTGQT